jgi:hypothetical protein
MKNFINISLLVLFMAFMGAGCGWDYPIDEDGLLITERDEAYVSNFELLSTDYQTVRVAAPVITHDTTATGVITGTIDVTVFWGTNLKQLWPQFSLVTDAKLNPKITGWTDFSDLATPTKWTVISGNRKVTREYTLNITVQPKP